MTSPSPMRSLIIKLVAGAPSERTQFHYATATRGSLALFANGAPN